MKRVLKSLQFLFVLLCISIVNAGFLSVASPLTLPHLKILFGEGHENLPNPIEIVKSFIPRRGCGLHCRNKDYEDQEQHRETFPHNSHRHHGHGFDREGFHQPQFPQHQQGFMHGNQYSQNPHLNENRRPQQTYGVPYDNWQNTPSSQQSYNPPMFINNQAPPAVLNPSNAEFHRPLPGQPSIVETGYNPSTYQNYNPQITPPQQNAPNQPNIMEQAQFVEPSLPSLPYIMQANANPSWGNQPQIVEPNSCPSCQNQPNLKAPNQLWQNHPAIGESSSNPWQNQAGMFDSDFNKSNGFINNGPNIVETPSIPTFQTSPPTTTNLPNLMNSIFYQKNATNSKSSPSINPAQETNDFIYPDSTRYVHKSISEIDIHSPLIDIRRR